MEYIGEKELDDKLNDFRNHLENADRMILSARFGDGKSFFLQKVRENTKKFSDYEFITIYPVNYVVAPNEDIFEYIKRDILVQLAQHNLLNDIDLTKIITSIFSFENFKEVISFLISCVPGGNVYNKLLDKAFKISEKYSAEKSTYEKYFGIFNQQRGGLYENDVYTLMIKEALNLMKNGYINGGSEIKKKPVLIIEDLDRLDPAHLFRILNVISAHIDDCSKPDKVGNKFGFSNIVIVMDYETTQHIFEHFYGKEASYTGYMSKFLSEEPFRYSIVDLALPQLKEKIMSIVGINKDLFETFTIVNKKLSKLSMRDIVRLYDFDVSTRVYKPTFKTKSGYELSTQLPVFKLVIYMTELGMSYVDIDEMLGRWQTNGISSEYLKLIYPLYLILDSNPQNLFEYGLSYFQVQLKKEENIIVAIDIKNSSFNNKASSINVLRKDYASCFRLLGKHIDLASFNRSEKYSMQGYRGKN